MSDFDFAPAGVGLDSDTRQRHVATGVLHRIKKWHIATGVLIRIKQWATHWLQWHSSTQIFTVTHAYQTSEFTTWIGRSRIISVICASWKCTKYVVVAYAWWRGMGTHLLRNTLDPWLLVLGGDIKSPGCVLSLCADRILAGKEINGC